MRPIGKGKRYVLFGTPNGAGYHLVLRKRIDKADLTGMKIRCTLFYDPLIKGLGGAPVRIAGGEIYTALERGWWTELRGVP
jgi:TRAP-type mannitol/chloroaromatic compound transport system substrate-binding protein